MNSAVTSRRVVYGARWARLGIGSLCRAILGFCHVPKMPSRLPQTKIKAEPAIKSCNFVGFFLHCATIVAINCNLTALIR